MTRKSCIPFVLLHTVLQLLWKWDRSALLLISVALLSYMFQSARTLQSARRSVSDVLVELILCKLNRNEYKFVWISHYKPYIFIPSAIPGFFNHWKRLKCMNWIQQDYYSCFRNSTRFSVCLLKGPGILEEGCLTIHWMKVSTCFCSVTEFDWNTIWLKSASHRSCHFQHILKHKHCWYRICECENGVNMICFLLCIKVQLLYFVVSNIIIHVCPCCDGSDVSTTVGH